MLSAIFRFFSLYPFQTFLLCFSLTLVNILEGIGIGLLIPVFQKLIASTESQSRFTEWFDKILYSMHLEPNLINTLFLLCIVFIIRAIVTFWGRHISTKISSDFQFQLKQQTYGKLMNAKLEFFWEHRQGDLMNILTTEANRASAAFFQSALWVSGLLSVVLYIGLALFISGWLAVIAGLAGATALSPLNVIVRKARQFGDKTTELNEIIQNELLNMLGAIKVLKGASNEKNAFKRFTAQNKVFRDLWYKITFNANSIQIYAQPIAVILLSILLYSSVKWNINVAELMVFLLIFMRMLPGFSGLQGQQHNVNSNMPGYDRILSLLNELDSCKERQGGIKINGLKKEIRFKHVAFEYVKGKPVLDDINFSISANNTIAFVGPSGSGKSTIVDMILGFYIPKRGQMLIDDINLEEIDLSSWRRHIAYVTQDVVLFNDTVTANISWGDEKIPMEKIIEATKMAAAHDFIVALENGYNTLLGDRGIKLSGGQRQRLALARALLQNPKILILDEATSALDHHSEIDIKNSIIKLKRHNEITIIIIAHRLTTVQEADDIFVLDQGHIVERGNWKQLMANEKGYITKIIQEKNEVAY